MEDKSFSELLNNTIAEKSLLQHPFYRKWSEGKLTVTELREYAKQYYYFVKHFPRFVSCVHSNCEDIEVRRMLMQNLSDEEGYKSEYKDHPSLWLDFAKSLGLSDEEISNTKPLDETKALIDGMYELSRSCQYELGLAALYAYESQIPEIAKTKINGLKHHYGIESDTALKYFTVHEEFDVYHSQDELNAIIRKCTESGNSDYVVSTAEKSSWFQWNFLDGIYNNFCQS
ncbi:CADD family putative folate metabolism protein [Ignavibacteria bacterium CHB1]|nr:MAG: CADD family putative folate metabolism protein [Chlorobiota bacterium]MBV6398730.1 PqqC-like protein [Ignavibacteria bacterium]MCC6885100.1 CADD family putative folate metabolism protein [Ignavibacteriales bacterium]MCE7952110.1 CADD family putative folate metabolism protein [Chlorobi bacterium CHB7]MDL1886333.1 CADD family putative folate metabolism protein [Ignavibacteria bacterium CHB1]